MTNLDPDGIMSNHESHSSTGCGWERYSGRDHCLYYRLAEALAAATEREQRVRALSDGFALAGLGDYDGEEIAADIRAALDGPEGDAR